MREKFMLLVACLFMSVGLVTAQTSTVSGIVVSEEDGEPVIGASILVVGTTLGSVTDIDGKFSISGVPHSAKNYVSLLLECKLKKLLLNKGR